MGASVHLRKGPGREGRQCPGPSRTSGRMRRCRLPGSCQGACMHAQLRWPQAGPVPVSCSLASAPARRARTSLMAGSWLGRFGQRQVRLDLVAVAAAVFLLHHVAGFGQVGDDAAGAALGDVHAGRDVAQPHARVVGDAQQHSGVAGKETPVGCQNSATGLDLGVYAARWYSLMRPPRTGRRLRLIDLAVAAALLLAGLVFSALNSSFRLGISALRGHRRRPRPGCRRRPAPAAHKMAGGPRPPAGHRRRLGAVVPAH